MTVNAADLRRALRNGDLAIAYQPQWDLRGSWRGNRHPTRPVAVEALARWNRPGTGEIAPMVFVPLAERAQLLAELDIQILRRAAVQVASWRAAGATIGLSVNAAPSHFSAAYADAAVRLTREVGLDPTALTVEITESPAPQFSSAMTVALETLTAAGISVSVDDFGAGDTTLEGLEHLPVNEVKLDRSLIQSRQAADTVDDVVTLARHRHWRVVAEGIETEEELQYAAQHGCDRGQGFLWGRPAPAAVIEPLLA